MAFVVNQQVPGANNIPDVSDALLDWFQPMVFTTVVKSVGIDFKVAEVPTNINFQGVWQPMSPQILAKKPEGQRQWKWFTCHSTQDLGLKPDDVINYNGTQYRVDSKMDWSGYGYIEYHLVDNFTGSGP